MAQHQRTFLGFDEEPAPRGPRESVPGPRSLEGQTVFVVDAYSLIYQVFHALPEMTSPTGQPVGAVHGFTRDLMTLLESKRPNYLFCAFDTASGETFRHGLYDQYKATREAMPDDLRAQIANIRRMLAALGIPALGHDNYEADDLLATVARRAAEAGGTCLLVSADKDCRQLLSDRVTIYNLRKDREFDAANLMEEWGVRPEQVVDFQSLVGDSVDNVPGVPLIGPKLARELLGRYGSLERVLDHAHEVSGKKRRENLVQFRDQALLSRRLVRLKDDVPIRIDWEAGRVGGIDGERVRELCGEFGFRRLADQLSQMAAPAAPARWRADYEVVDSPAALRSLIAKLSACRRISLEAKATSTHPRWAEIVGISFAWREGEAAYLPFRAPQGDPRLDLAATLHALRPLLEDPRLEKVGHDLKYAIIVLRALGVELSGLACDTMVADYLLDPGQRNHGLDDLAHRYLNHAAVKIEDLLGVGKQRKRIDQVPLREVTPHAAREADVSLRVASILERKLDEEGLRSLFSELEMPLIGVLADLEFHGIRIDVPRLEALGRRLGQRLAELEREIHSLAGGSFNVDSPKQLAKVLFETLRLPISKRTKTGPSTDADVLGDLAKLHPLPAKIIDYRRSAKLKGTYADALPALVLPRTGRVHTSFKQDVAATGRLSSTDPNLQNVPVRTAEGREIRSAFVPGEEGWRLLTADYSQIELRVLAHYSRDDALCQAFADELDIHARVASEVHGVPLEQVTPEMRGSAKAVNFGVIYGQSPFGLAKSLDISQEDAARFIDSYFARYPGVEKFMQKVLEECRRNGYVNTVLGRRRVVHGIRDFSRPGSSRLRNLPERIAINTVIQGSAADLIKQSMILVSERLRRENLRARMLLQIHDELVFEVPADEVTRLATLARQEMASVGRLRVPLKVDVKVGDNWMECEAWD